MNASARRAALVLALFLAVAALVLSGFFGQVRDFRSVELAFTDRSQGSGLAIVPASCPSSPHYSGECEGIPPNPRSGCSIISTPSSVADGGSATLGWATATKIGNVAVTSSGSVEPGIGVVAPRGATGVSPSRTTTYTYAGRFYMTTITGARVDAGGFSCSTTLSVGDDSSCTQGYVCRGDDLYYRSRGIDSEPRGGQAGTGGQCTERFIQTCAYSCSAGACNAAPTPSAVFAVQPKLVRKYDTVTVLWSAQNVQSCTVTGTNGDSWSGTTGTQISRPITAQTIYTLRCSALPGALPSSIVYEETVNIIPEWLER